MVKLTNVRPAISSVPPVLARITDEHGHSDAIEPWRRWYKSKRWQQLKQRVHLRDNYTCQRTGIVCAGKGKDWNAPVAHHKIAHRGDPDLFWDENNVITVTKQEHDGPIAAEEAAQRAAGL